MAGINTVTVNIELNEKQRIRLAELEESFKEVAAALAIAGEQATKALIGFSEAMAKIKNLSDEV